MAWTTMLGEDGAMPGRDSAGGFRIWGSPCVHPWGVGRRTLADPLQGVAAEITEDPAVPESATSG